MGLCESTEEHGAERMTGVAPQNINGQSEIRGSATIHRAIEAAKPQTLDDPDQDFVVTPPTMAEQDNDDPDAKKTKMVVTKSVAAENPARRYQEMDSFTAYMSYPRSREPDPWFLAHCVSKCVSWTI